MTAIPAGWARVTVADVAIGGHFSDGDWVESKDQDPAGDVRLTQLADVGVGVFRDRSDRWMRADQARALGCTYLRPGDLLIARMPDPIARACLVPDNIGHAVTAVDVAILRTARKDVDLRYLSWHFNSPQFTSAATALQSGTTRKRISRKKLSRLTIPLPPLDEQRRIVALLADHLSRLDTADAYLVDAQRRLDALTRSRLRSSLRGSGTWEASLSDVCGPASPPKSVVAAKAYLDEGRWPVVDQGEGDVGGYTENEDAAYQGQLPVIVFGDHTRRIKFVDRPFAVGAQGTKLLRPHPGVHPRFAFWTLKDIDLSARGYGRHYALLRAARPRMASAERQRAIVATMDAAVDEQASLQKSLDMHRTRLNALRRAVLTAAFTGRLTGRVSDLDIAEELADATA